MRIVSFSLFGGPSIYTFGAVVNAYRIGRTCLEGWTPRFYWTNSVPPETRELLKYFGAEMVYVQPGDVPSPIFARLLVMTDSNVDEWICREAEARPGGQREEWAIEEWEDSGAAWHVIKDHSGCALHPVYTGCFGGRSHIFDLEDRMFDWAGKQKKPVHWAEDKQGWFFRNQEFVRDCLWDGMLAQGTLVHWCEGARKANKLYAHYEETEKRARSFPPELEDGSYIGEAIGYDGKPLDPGLRKFRGIVNALPPA